MNAHADSPGSFPDSVVSMPRLAEILERTTKGRVHTLRLLGLDGEVILRVERGRPGEPDPAGPRRSARSAVVVRGQTMALVEALGGSDTDPESLSHAAADAAAQIAETWGVAQEIDSLASEIIHAYEELHLLYELGESLAQQMSVASASGLILERLRDAIPARRVELRLEGREEVILTQPGAAPDLSADSQSQRLVTQLRSAGKSMGLVVLIRAGDEPAFTSVEAKLLDGVGTIAASALHNALLFEQLCHQAEALSEREANLSAVMDNVAEGILTVDERGQIASFNPAAESLFGYPLADIVGKPFRILAPELDANDSGDRVSELVDRFALSGDAVEFETIGQRKDGSSFPMDVTVSSMQANRREMLIVSVRDVTERRRWEEVLEHQAHHDALTDLPNRNLLARHLAQEIRAANESSHKVALLLMDLDHFKEVNDTLGHQAGDRLLQQIGPRLKGMIRSKGVIARLGGDEFAVIMGRADEEQAIQLALELLQALDRPFIIDGHSLGVSASIGIALCPDHGPDADTLLKHSDVAMYEAKRGQCGYKVYAPEQDSHSPSRLELKAELRAAIEKDQFILHYQPQVSLRTGLVTHVEALLRWLHPERGLIMPSQFISLAEQLGLIDGLSRWVLGAALAQTRAWLDQGYEITVAVNLSAHNLRDPRLPETIARLLKERGVPPEMLKIEITESSLMSDPLYSFKILSRLSAMGVRIGIDDFGTGYSSLAYLKRLPVDEIKIDKSFVMQMASDENDQAIVRSTIGLGHDLGLVVVAEGVENLHTQDLLSVLGCDLAQGYYLGRPVPPDDLVRAVDALRESSGTMIDEVSRATLERRSELLKLFTAP